MSTFPSRKVESLRGVYPGTFNPPTVAHLAIATAAHRQFGLESVDLILSLRPFDKEGLASTIDERLAVVEKSVADLPWLSVRVTDKRLLADIADGYDVLIMGGDKWAQLHEERFYDSPLHMEECLRRLPQLAIAARPPHALPIPSGAALQVSDEFLDVSSTAARSTRVDWMTEAARLHHHPHPGQN